MARVTKKFSVPDIEDIGPSVRRPEDDIATSKAIAQMKKAPGHAAAVRKLDRVVARLKREGKLSKASTEPSRTAEMVKAKRR